MTKTISNKLWERKIPQYIGTYLAVGFGLFQFVEVIIKRFKLNESLQDRYLILWLALLPAVFVFVYFGFQPNGKQAYEKKKWPKFFIGINIIIAIALSLFLINGKEDKTKNTVEIVQLLDEDGQDIKAIVPALKKVKSIACFQFENLTNDASNDWLGVSMSALLGYSLEQHPEFYVASAYALNRYYDGLGLEPFTIPNIGMQSTIAKKSRNDYFCRISYAKKNNVYILKGSLIRTKDGKVIADINTKNTDIYSSLDAVKEQILKKLQPKTEKDIKADNNFVLPASTLISDNKKALEFLTKSRILQIKDPNELDEVLNLSKQSTIEDPTCSQCYLNVAYPLLTQGKKDEALIYLKNAIKYGTSLPKRMQFSAKELYYNVNNNVEAAIKLQEFRKDMFPYDFTPYGNLLSYYKSEYGISKAKELIQEAIDNGNTEKGLLTLFNLQLENEEYDVAEKTLDEFFKEFPNKEQDKLRYATLYESKGDHKKARQRLIEQEILDPFDTQIKTRIALLDFKNLKLDAAMKRINDGLKQASTLTDSLTFLQVKIYFEFKMGQMQNAFNSIDQYETYAVKTNSLYGVLSQYSSTKSLMHLATQKPKKAKEVMHELVSYNPAFKVRYFCGINTQATINGYNTFLDTDTLDCESLYNSYGGGYIDYYSVVKLYRNKKYKECITLLEKDDNRVLKLFDEKFFIADIYYKAELKKEAIAILKNEISKKPDDPIYYYKLGSLLKDKNKFQAKIYIDKALKFWKNADSDFIIAKKANQIVKDLTL